MKTSTKSEELKSFPPTDNSPDNGQPEKATKKKYHSSALYAARKWHNTVNYVKPVHASLNL